MDAWTCAPKFYNSSSSTVITNTPTFHSQASAQRQDTLPTICGNQHQLEHEADTRAFSEAIGQCMGWAQTVNQVSPGTESVRHNTAFWRVATLSSTPTARLCSEDRIEAFLQNNGFPFQEIAGEKANKLPASCANENKTDRTMWWWTCRFVQAI